MSDNSVDALIGELSEGLQPMKPLPHPLWRAVPMLLAVALYVGFIVYSMGIRHDALDAIKDPILMYELGLALLVAVSSMCCVTWLCVPDMRDQSWMIAVPFSLFGAFILWVSLRILDEGLHFPMSFWMYCFPRGIIMSCVPTAILVFMSRYGATTRPYLMATMIMMTVSSMGFIGLRMTCPVDTVGHAVIYHLLPFTFVGAALGLLARKLCCWCK